MTFLLANWKWILPSALAAFFGVWLGISRIELAELKLSIAEQKTAAETIRADAETNIADAVRKNLQLNNLIEAERAKAQSESQAHAADIAAANIRISKLLNNSRNPGSCELPTSQGAAGNSESGPTPSQLSRALGRLIERGGELAKEADDTALDGIACHTFAVSK